MKIPGDLSWDFHRSPCGLQLFVGTQVVVYRMRQTIQGCGIPHAGKLSILEFAFFRIYSML